MTAITARPIDRYSKFLSVGSARGSRVVTNEEMCTMIDSTPEWIEQRTGITERRWGTDSETVLSMGTEAARTALERAGLNTSQIDAIIVATVSHHHPSPSLATYIARELGLGNAAAFDLNGACAGFCYSVAVADSMIRTGSASYVLVIGVEKLSEMTNLDDRSTAFLFSDGAGAAVIGPSDEPGIGPVVWGSRSDKLNTIEIEDWSVASADRKKTHPLIHMEGRAVFKWAMTDVAKRAAEAVAQAGITPADLDVFIPHQANDRITEVICRHLKLPESVTVCHDIADMGNTSAASVPIAIDRMLRRGEAHSGDLALIIGFGAGLVYAGQVVRLPSSA
ncbi:beta-ketoacyl-ACP synthase III [Cutibacterium sp.]|uniref:beta-ketoacyl-ACP synthase III n=1 Tax=Cutibacterium sp. TaxID=1912221 RepID=UPI0026DB4A00|nr:beta-ketoacyl-ACP synthase III [Cutibacterium sp.]MDO4411796.1 beta-ketoacyl-ACP synthase III [Cutibacterium sp.]